MPQQARVRSVEAIESFRASLLVYLDKARGAVEDVGDTVLRTRLWLQNDQRVHWQAQLRRRLKELEMAQQELFSGRQSGLEQGTAAKQMAVNRARQNVTEAQKKLALLKKWNHRYESEAAPMAKHLERLRGLMSQEMRKATALLGHTIDTLEAYAGRSGAASATEPAAPDPEHQASTGSEPESPGPTSGGAG